MKLKMKSLILCGIMTLAVAAPASATVKDYKGEGKTESACFCFSISKGHYSGIVRNSNSNGTCALSYVGCNGVSLGTQVNINGKTMTGYGTSYAQTSETICVAKNVPASEKHWQR